MENSRIEARGRARFYKRQEPANTRLERALGERKTPRALGVALGTLIAPTGQQVVLLPVPRARADLTAPPR